MNHYLPWLILSGHVALLLFVDWFVLHKKDQPNNPKKAIFETLFFVVNALIFGGAVYWFFDTGLAVNPENLSPSIGVVKYITGYIIELSLSVDNLFVIALIFAAYKIPSHYQHKLLFLGIVALKLTTSHWFDIPEWFSLLFIGISLAMGVWVSSIKSKDSMTK